MLVSGKKLSKERILEYVRRGDYSLTFEGAIRRFGTAFVTIQQIPKEVEEYIPPEGNVEDSFMPGLYVPSNS